MKNFISYLIAGVSGGVICFTLLLLTNNHKVIIDQPSNTPVAKPVVDEIRPVTGASFVKAAKQATGAVVHIYAEESEALAQQRYQDQRRKRRGFGDSMIEDFFGGNFFGGDYFRRQNGSGSGVIYSKDGYIVTNNHVVGFADKITVTLQDGKKYKAKRIGTDESTDLAVIKIEADDLKTMDIANSDHLEVGEWVLAVGNPFDYLTSTVTAGIVSAKGRDLNMIESEKPIEEFIQTDAAINPGNSGGALVTADGELVGINTAIATPTGVYAGYSFAIPSNLMKMIVDDIIETGSDIHRVNLGVGGYDVDESLIEEFDLKVKRGFYVADVETRSSAKLAGIVPGDVIIAIDNKDVSNFDDISDILKFSKSGDKIELTVSRNGKKIKVPTYLRKGL
jgi:S1-C subfamily serine protease